MTYPCQAGWGMQNCKDIDVKIGLLWCHSHVELRLIEVEVDWSWGWLKLRLIEFKVNSCFNLWNVFEVSSCRLITFILFHFCFLTFWFCGYSRSFWAFWAILGCLVVDVRAEIYFNPYINHKTAQYGQNKLKITLNNHKKSEN